MSSPKRRHGVTAGVLTILLGGCLVAATIIWQWGHLAYGLGVAATALGCVTTIVASVRGRVTKVVAGVAVVVLVGAGGLVAVTGLPDSSARWEDPEAVGPGGQSASVEGLFVAGGTARDIETGDVVWEVEDGDPEPSLVSPDLVVLSNDDASIGLETRTGREVWRSPVSGRGIAHDGGVLVVAHTGPDDETEAVALDVATGEIVWSRPGRPVMECSLGPADRFSPALERSHVLFVPDEENDSRAELLDVADGTTTVADVDCSLTARVVGSVLVEAQRSDLVGRSLTDGEQLWVTPVARPWSIEGGGPVVYTPTDTSDQRSTDITAIDVATGQTSAATPPSGVPGPLSGLEVRRSPEVWVVVDHGSGVELWNPGTGETTEIPDATYVEVESVDVFSGWTALSGEVRDLTGEASSRCWALSPSGELFGPVPGRSCTAAEGLLKTTSGIFPVL